MSDHRLSIGKVAERTGCNVETIRYYERERLLPKPERSEGGHRMYAAAQVDRLIFIRRSRELGFSMAEIRELLSLVDTEQISCEVVRSITANHLRDVRSKIADLQRVESTLRELSARCSGSDVPECPIIDALQPK